jgi:hypothetical protein
LGTLPSGTETYFAQWGFIFNDIDVAATSATNAAAFLLRWSGSAVEMVTVTRNSGGTVQSTLITHPTDSLVHAYRIDIPASGDIVFRLDGSTVATHSTKTSTTAGARTGGVIAKTAGTTERHIDVDWFYLLGSNIR